MECKNGDEHTVASCLADQSMFHYFQLCCRIFSMLSNSAYTQMCSWLEKSWLRRLRKLWLYFSKQFPFAGNLNLSLFQPIFFSFFFRFLSCQSLLLCIFSHKIICRSKPILTKNFWHRWFDGWAAFTLWDTRNQWKSVGRRKNTSICRSLDKQADRQETQSVSQSTYI